MLVKLLAKEEEKKKLEEKKDPPKEKEKKEKTSPSGPVPFHWPNPDNFPPCGPVCQPSNSLSLILGWTPSHTAQRSSSRLACLAFILSPSPAQPTSPFSSFLPPAFSLYLSLWAPTCSVQPIQASSPSSALQTNWVLIQQPTRVDLAKVTRTEQSVLNNPKSDLNRHEKELNQFRLEIRN